MIFKTIDKKLKEEGITIELLNSINMDLGYSPVQFRIGGMEVESTHMLRADKGYWTKTGENEYLRDHSGRLHITVEKEVQIARARFLLKFGQAEKDMLIDQKIFSWQKRIKEEINRVHQGQHFIPSSMVTKMYNCVPAEHQSDHAKMLKWMYEHDMFVELINILSLDVLMESDENDIRLFAGQIVDRKNPWLSTFSYKKNEKDII